MRSVLTDGINQAHVATNPAIKRSGRLNRRDHRDRSHTSQPAARFNAPDPATPHPFLGTKTQVASPPTSPSLCPMEPTLRIEMCVRRIGPTRLVVHCALGHS